MSPLVPLHSYYVRACNACANTWVVDRRLARRVVARGRPFRTIRNADQFGVSMDIQAGTNTLADLAQQNTEGASVSALGAAMATCNRCGISDFVQRPQRRDERK